MGLAVYWFFLGCISCSLTLFFPRKTQKRKFLKKLISAVFVYRQGRKIENKLAIDYFSLAIKNIFLAFY
ncbi:hypothetical protein A946_02445 [Methylacidiphilum kamchatkense Kam1]|uniref:Uncharacterized protein n=1 Tax=Methylacidiphilum kamchatkense Kam1 TaxID=1202785 RepID=A0ABR4ZYW6_9BACT|nr:hypothetical protein A946_02445 [Methylacidiphilum kamchatkense Kam1]